MARSRVKTISSKGASFVLTIGDEGAILVQMQKKKVIRRLFAQSPDPDHTRSIDDAFRSAPTAPITILIDMMDQSYVRQTLPPVSSLSVGKIVRRRLDKDFSPDDIKGYLVLGREKTGRKDWNYLMASLANTPQLQNWLAFVVERSNPFRGIGLVPLEAQAFMIAVEKALLKQEGKDAKSLEWQILVNHHKVGGFRQVVLRRDRIIFTRMAQPIGDSSPIVTAGNIEQELTNTLEYLKRMGLQDTTTLSVVVIASDEIKRSLDRKNIKAGKYHFFTPFETAQLLGIGDAAQAEDQFADVVLSAFVMRQRKMLLTLQTNYTQRLKGFSANIFRLWLGGGLAVAGILGWAGMSAYDIFSNKEALDDLETQRTSLQQALISVKNTSKKLPKDLPIYSDTVTMVKLFDKRLYDPLAFVQTLADALNGDALVTGYDWSVGELTLMARDSDKRMITTEIGLRFTIPPQPRDHFAIQAMGVLDRIRKAYPEFDVTHTELPGILSENKDIQAVIEDSSIAQPAPVETTVPAAHRPLPGSQDAAADADTVKVSIKGPTHARKPGAGLGSGIRPGSGLPPGSR
jgi:hypothetical protein